MSEVKGEMPKKNPAADAPKVEMPAQPAAPISPPAAAAPIVPLAAAAPPRKIDPLNEMSFQEHGWKQMHYDAIAAPGVQPADVLKREYWSHVSQKLRPMTKISIMADDRSWYGEVVVFQSYLQGALVAFVHPPVRLEKSGVTREESEYDIIDGGMSKSWCVVRRKDQRFVSEGHTSEAAASMWLSNFLKAQGAPRSAA